MESERARAVRRAPYFNNIPCSSRRVARDVSRLAARVTPRVSLRLLELHDRAHLERAVLRAGNARRHLDRVLHVLGVDQVIAPQLLLGLDVGPVGRRDLAVANANAGRGVGGLERVAADVLAGLPDAVAERPILAEALVHVRPGSPLPTLLVLLDHALILHNARQYGIADRRS